MSILSDITWYQYFSCPVHLCRALPGHANLSVSALSQILQGKRDRFVSILTSLEPLKQIPPYVLIFMCCTSYRVHSIYVLRLFNDPVAMLFLYASLNAFTSERWSIGSIFYSLAVSLKMNVLLFAPALFLAFVERLDGGWLAVLKQLTICATVQVN